MNTTRNTKTEEYISSELLKHVDQKFIINVINILKDKTESGNNMKEKQEYKVPSRS